MSQDKISRETVLSVHRWTAKLFSFTLTRSASFRFSAGQFARIGLDTPAANIFRAYSIVSSPFDEVLEFFSIVVPDGAFSSQLQYLKAGDTLLLDKTPYGFLTLARFQQPAPKDLWLLATGTGLAPFLSILQDFKTWQDYRHIVLAYSVSVTQDLAYIDKIQQIVADFGHPNTRFIFLPLITQDPNAPLNQRFPVLIANGQLEAAAGLKFDNTSSHIMLCGNPAMVADTRHALMNRGLKMNRKGEGHIAVENYW